MPNDTNRNRHRNIPISGFNNTDSTKKPAADEEEIDLVDLFYALLDQLKWILLVAIFCAGIMFVKDAYFTQPQYESTRTTFLPRRARLLASWMEMKDLPSDI